MGGIPWGSERARDFHSLNWSRGRHWPLALHRIRKKKQSKTPLAPCISASALVAHYLTRNCFLNFFLLLRRERKKKPRNGCNRWWLHRDVKEGEPPSQAAPRIRFSNGDHDLDCNWHRSDYQGLARFRRASYAADSEQFRALVRGLEGGQCCGSLEERPKARVPGHS